MRISSFFFGLQALVLGTVYADFAGIISPKPAAGSTFWFSIPTADTSPSSSATSPTSTDDAFSSLENAHLTCHTDFPMADMAGSEVFVKACSLIGKKITLLVTHLNVEMELLQYIDPTIPQELLTLDLYAYKFETEHGCRTSNQEKTHCIWMSRLRGEVFQLRAKMRGPDDTDYDGIDLETLNWKLRQILDEMDQIVAELGASMSLDPSQLVPVFYETLVRGNRLQKLLERATDLEKEAKCPERGSLFVCKALRELKEAARLTLRGFPGEVVMDA